MKKPEICRFREKTEIHGRATALANGKFRPNAVVIRYDENRDKKKVVAFEGPLFETYLEAAQYAVDHADTFRAPDSR